MCRIASNLPVTCIRSLRVGGALLGVSKTVVLLLRSVVCYTVLLILPYIIFQGQLDRWFCTEVIRCRNRAVIPEAIPRL